LLLDDRGDAAIFWDGAISVQPQPTAFSPMQAAAQVFVGMARAAEHLNSSFVKKRVTLGLQGKRLLS
jgi:hypothetical protein